jgi:hypothetical protein
MWWLALSLWLICIIEVSAKAYRIIGNAEEPWFNIFSVIFEIVSAYGTVGLSLGSSNANFSYVPLFNGSTFADIRLSGNFKILSKLVMMVVMLRGRHRGLPMAVRPLHTQCARLTTFSSIVPSCYLPISTRLKMKSRMRTGTAARLMWIRRPRRYMLGHRPALNMPAVQGL